MLSYQKIQQIYKDEVKGIYEGHVDVEEKLDGCFQSSTRIRLTNGETEHIGKIVKNKLPLEVLSYNFKTNRLESKKIVNWFVNGNTKEWLHITCKGKTVSMTTKLKVTGNHMIYVKKDNNIKKIRADEIKIGDIVLKPVYKLDYIERQLIYGSLLGDASIALIGDSQNARFSVGHSEKQVKYLDLKEKILHRLLPYRDTVISGYGSTMHRFRVKALPELTSIYNKCSVNKKKKVTREWINELGVMGIAFWYMDDGSTVLNVKGNPRAHFATNSFSNEECDLLVNYFKNMGYDASYIDHGKGNTLSLSTESSEKLFNEISFFIPQSMQYKLPVHCRHEITFWDNYDFDKMIGMNLVESDVLSIDNVVEYNREKFDIEVEDNHNYFANNTLVSNFQFRIQIDTDGTITCGSHHQDGVTIGGMFNLGVEQANKIFNGYKPPYRTTVFCEYFSKPKQNTIAYARIPNNNLILFDVQVDTLYLRRNEKEAFANDHNMEITPLLWAGDGSEVTDDLIKHLLTTPSMLGHQAGFDRIEGIVVKNYDKLYDITRYRQYEEFSHPWMSAKIVNDSFKEKNHDENPNRTNKFQELKDSYRTEARMLKSIQHLKEQGLLVGELADLRLLVPEVIRDIIEEEKEDIKERLWNLYGNEIVGYASKEMVPTYKKCLTEN